MERTTELTFEREDFMARFATFKFFLLNKDGKVEVQLEWVGFGDRVGVEALPGGSN